MDQKQKFSKIKKKSEEKKLSEIINQNRIYQISLTYFNNKKRVKSAMQLCQGKIHNFLKKLRDIMHQINFFSVKFTKN